MNQRWLSFVLAAALSLSMLALPAAGATVGDENEAAVVLSGMNVLSGYADGLYHLEDVLTRAQFCKMAVCAMDGEGELGLYNTVTVYPDVKPSHWASAYINMASKGKNIISGYSDGKFYPDKPVTLGQAATILLRILGYQDKSIGGVWPKSYVAAASRAGLMDGVGASDGNAVVTRGQAARMFMNLLKADCVGENGGKEGTYLSKIGMEAREDVVLVSSSSTGADGKKNALQLASGEVYQLREEKQSSGVLNGFWGTLVLKNGKAVTFLPGDTGSRTVVLAGAGALQLTDTTGMRYSVENETGVYYNGKQQAWSSVYSWLNPGTSLTLYLNKAGNVAYIVAGGGTSSNEAVVVYKNGSVAGFDSLAGGAGGYTIYKNGNPATARDLMAYDVAVYSGATNSVRVSDTKLTGVYEDCRPSPSEAAFITVMGCELPVLTTAQASVAAFTPGDQVTLLLTEDNQVAGAVRAENGQANLGVVKSCSGGSAEVDLLCGLRVKGKADEAAANAGELVRVISEERGVLRLVRQGGSDVRGELNLTARRLGTVNLAASVTVYEYGADGLKTVNLSDLPGVVPADQVSYARKNWAGNVDVVVLGSSYSRNTVLYGRAAVTSKSNGEAGGRTYYLEVENGRSHLGPFPLNDDIYSGDYVAVSASLSGEAFTSVSKLTKLADVPNTAWTGKTAVTVNGRTYTVPDTVSCYNRDTKNWMTLDAAHAYGQKADLYASGDGVVRVIEVGR